MAEIRMDRLVSSRFDRVVAVEPSKSGSARVYRRLASGEVAAEETEFRPWLLTSGSLSGVVWPEEVETVPLAGEGRMTRMVLFPDRPTYDAAVKALRDAAPKRPSDPECPYRLVSDPQQQFLTGCPVRSFRGMAFPELRRLQLDIETYTTPGFDFPNADREADRIIVISLRDSSGWEACLGGHEMSEKEMLQRMVELVRERDPDVLEGHNIFDFDLPYIETRAKRHKVRLALGRDRSALRSRSSRFSAGGFQATYRRYEVHGRHIVDTLHLSRLYDVSHRALESHSLKYLARHFGVAAPERTYVEGSTISRVFEEEPERLMAYAMDDVRETEAISRILSPSYFYQAQLVPFSYQSCVTRGNAARIDAMLVAAYLGARRALPRSQPPRSFQGALTASPCNGVFQNVWHVDVRSLYPSILISRELGPASDTLEEFRRLLTGLRDFRLNAKDAARRAEDPGERDHYNALQTSFKILINSFYGYLGFAQGTFNDFDVAETVTATGRQIMQSMLDYLNQAGATVVELDTDGVYFVPPPEATEPSTMQQRVQSILPDGIEVELDHTYPAMFAYKAKNYALLEHGGEITITGAALKSRGLEPFQRRYVRDFVEFVLKGDASRVADLLERYRCNIFEHRLPLADFAKREVLSTPPRVYKQKLETGKGRRSAAYELVLASERDYRQGDPVLFYVTGSRKNVAVADAARLLHDADESQRDENVPYYLDKLAKLHKKLAAAL